MFDPVFLDSVLIEARLDGAEDWTVLEDVLQTSSITIHRGNDGSSQMDRVAQTGTMEFRVNNAEDNSTELLGLYSPNNPNVLPGWRVGIPVRCRVVYAGESYVLFSGKIDAIQPVSGKFRDRYVTVTCTDWMEEAARSRIRGLPLQVDELSSVVFRVVAEAVEEPPPGGFDIQAGADTFPYALDSAHDGEINAMSEFQRIAQSELSRAYVTREGVAVYESRHYRPNTFDLFETLTDEDIDGVEAGRGREDIINHTEVEVHPRRVDLAPTTVLFELAQPKKIVVGETVEINVLFRDPDSRATRVGGIDMVQPVASTDFLFNELENGTGINRTANIAAIVEYGANSGTARVTNSGPGDGWLTVFRCRGRGIYDYETLLVTADDQASKDRYGEAGFPFDMPYQADFGVAKDAAEFILNQSKEILTQIRAVRFWANREDRLMLAALLGEISHKIGLSETVIGTQTVLQSDEGPQVFDVNEFFINGVSLEIMERGIIKCTWSLEPADPLGYWILDDVEQSVLGSTTRLAYGSFQTGWILDESLLGIDTVLASE